MVRRDTQTLTLPGIKRPAGRPRTGKALTPAQRQAAYRNRLKTIPQDVYDAAWDTVKQAIRGDFDLTIAEARSIYQAEVVKAREAVFTSYGPSTTVTKSQK
jgi:hypothetical protein